MEELKKLIEAIVFISGEPVKLNQISKTFNISINEIKKAVYELITEKYSIENSGIILNLINDEIVLTTNNDTFEKVAVFFNYDKQKQLTNAALEVLSIIAYKQPITKGEIDSIRGVKSDHVISKLINDDFIYISDRLDAPGIPNLYSTTNKFLLKFNLNSLDELPKLEEYGEEI